MMLMGVGQYFFRTDMVREMFVALGYPAYLVVPLGVAKLAGLAAILSKKSELLKEWAYVGFAYVFILGAAAHIVSGVPSSVPVLVAFALLIISHYSEKKLSQVGEMGIDTN